MGLRFGEDGKFGLEQFEAHTDGIEGGSNFVGYKMDESTLQFQYHVLLSRGLGSRVYALDFTQ
eukprot:scaffold43487_cov24-Attheya_sp.AAC.2